MTRHNRGLWLTAAAAIAFATVGCGEMTTTDAGNGCTTDSTCGTGKACHPVLKMCVKTCTGGTDCPSQEKTCKPINSSTASFCTCSTDPLCAAAVPGNVCNLVTNQCSSKCTTTSCPTAYTCNATSGQCVANASDGGTDGGTDAGVTDAGVTDAGVACSTGNNQPDTCGYANACGVNMTCQTAADDRCANITAAITASNYTAWNPPTSTGPVIYVATDDVAVAAGCTGATDVAFTTTLYAYAGPGYTFPATIGAATQLVYYTSTGAVRPVNNVLVGSGTNAWSHYIISNAGKNVEIKLTLCASAGTTGLTAGFAFTGGNALCIALTP